MLLVLGANAKKKSENVRNALLRYLDGENYDCANIKKIAKSKESASFINNDISCFITPTKVMGAVYFDTKCTNKYTIKETCDMEDFTSRKQVEKSCGYILYGLTDSQGEYGKDLFTIALGARNVKK